MRDLTLDRFSEELFSKKPIPGGGGAAALAGALAASLAGMAANLMAGKEKYKEYGTEIDNILTRAKELRLTLLKLIDEDAAAYNEVSVAYKMKPRDEEMLEKALIKATLSPLGIMEAAKETIEILDSLSDKTSKLVISDVGAGVKLAEAALSSAYLNVFANTKLMKNKNKAEEMEKFAKELYNYQKMADKIYKKVLIFLEC